MAWPSLAIQSALQNGHICSPKNIGEGQKKTERGKPKPLQINRNVTERYYIIVCNVVLGRRVTQQLGKKQETAKNRASCLVMVYIVFMKRDLDKPHTLNVTFVTRR